MAELWDHAAWFAAAVFDFVWATPLPVALLGLAIILVTDVAGLYLLLCLVAPKPRLSYPAEKTYQTVNASGQTVTRLLPCWYDKWQAERQLAAAEEEAKTRSIRRSSVSQSNKSSKSSKSRENNDDDDDMDSFNSHATTYNLNAIEPAEVALTVVVPAYNEELRLLPALEEMVDYCEAKFGRAGDKASATEKTPRGYEILLINDASTDNTAGVALDFARRRRLHDILRVVTLSRNRGKGGGVTHGFRHARGAHVVFADADGASRFGDLDRLLEGCDIVVDASGRGVAIGSRAHLVGSEAVVRRSALRNFLMKSFHFVLTILTPPATSRLRDTQCGFKLFSRPALPHIVPYMHTEGWIFDIEMLMLAESAPSTPVVAHDGTVIGTSPGIKVAEVPIHWHEVDGSKMNLVQDSIRMAIGLTVLRGSWMMGVYRRRLA